MIDLTPEEQRVLGALIEKHYTTPDVYPLTLNGLAGACNQSSNRSPVVSYDPATIQAALDGLREKGLVRIVYSQSNRAAKYRQVLEETQGLGTDDAAVLCVLLLRGPQTVGELRTRTERIHPFASLGEVEQTLDRLAGRGEPFVRRSERRPGQKETRFTHLLGDGPEPEPAAATVVPTAGAGAGLAEEVSRLRAEFEALRADFEALRDQLM
ncbi:MAG TPA: YceH family protein [Acidimicrobiales bacterium]|nr:YceH family protein [Acidimicrobiales bacterium]